MITKENRKQTHLTTKRQFHNTMHNMKTQSRIDEHLRNLMCDHVACLWLAFSILSLLLRLIIFNIMDNTAMVGILELQQDASIFRVVRTYLNNFLRNNVTLFLYRFIIAHLSIIDSCITHNVTKFFFCWHKYRVIHLIIIISMAMTLDKYCFQGFPPLLQSFIQMLTPLLCLKS